MTFKKWMQGYKGLHTPLGDLCADILNDRHFPRGNPSHGTILAHLQRQGACPECLTAFEEAWAAYSKENGGTTKTV